jgi:CheY-like chemotaxis protein
MIPRLLIVDDNRADIDLIILAFEEAGLNAFMVTAQDNQDAKEKMSHGRPDLVLLDINMPKSVGFELLKEIREDRQLGDTPVIMMSSSASIADQAHANRLGVMVYWVKPGRFGDWVALVQTLPALLPIFGRTAGNHLPDETSAGSLRPPS